MLLFFLFHIFYVFIENLKNETKISAKIPILLTDTHMDSFIKILPLDKTKIEPIITKLLEQNRIAKC